MEKQFVEGLLKRSREWKAGESEDFTFTTERNTWKLTLSREEDRYAPYKFAVRGVKNDGPETWRRRYLSAESAILHVLNHFNENANIQNRYADINDFLKTRTRSTTNN